MHAEERFKLLLNATAEQLAEVDAILAGESRTKPTSLRLLRMGEAASATGLSRTTLWRAIREGRLQAVKIREGSYRIPEAELRRFAGVS
jgi:excisionase family DNA binding protein